MLQKKWTTFLKAQISCSQQGLFPHTVVQDVFALPQAQGGGTIFYGVFASQWYVDRVPLCMGLLRLSWGGDFTPKTKF